jgi:hypothetical protein
MKARKKAGKSGVKRPAAKQKKATRKRDTFLVRFESGKSVAQLIDFSAGKQVQIG